ncbi:MAG: copper-binding protein [Deltaproteobacteria bacterium]|jgi:Cu/Ag efflux protein CusF|nr:copper-binding protein [Deltaproteobacteria bacterium]
MRLSLSPSLGFFLLPLFFLTVAILSAGPLYAQGHSHGGHSGHGAPPAAPAPPAVAPAPPVVAPPAAPALPPDGAAPADPSATTATDASSPLYEGRGVVIGVNPTDSEIAIAHEAIPAIGWEAMVMVFPVTDPTLLENVDNGDIVRFDLKAISPNGADYAIVDLEVK